MSIDGSVGFVGIGNMGWPMAHNLVDAGYRLTVHDADADRARRFASEHACAAAETPADFAEVDTVVTMLPDDRIVQEALLHWQGGIAAALRPGSLVIDMSSSNPRGTRVLGEELERREIALVDAPVSGGVPRATTGTLSLMIGGSDEDVARAWPLLEVLGDPLFRAGPLGAGHALKSLNNYAAASAYVTLAEATAIGLEYGLDPEVLVDVINTSTGRSFISEVVFKNFVLPGTYSTGFQLGLLAKDVGIAADLAKTAGVDAPAVEVVNRRWAEAAAALGGSVDHSLAHQHWGPADLTPGSAAPASREA